MGFKECLEMGTDFMEMHNPGVVYCIHEYVQCKKFGLPTIADGIRVKDCMTGEILGIVENKTLTEMFGDIDKLIGLDKEEEK